MINKNIDIMATNGTIDFYSKRLGIKNYPEILYTPDEDKKIVYVKNGFIIFNPFKLEAMETYYDGLNISRHIKYDMELSLIILGCIDVLEEEMNTKFSMFDKYDKFMSLCSKKTKPMGEYLFVRTYGTDEDFIEEVRQTMINGYRR